MASEEYRQRHFPPHEAKKVLSYAKHQAGVQNVKPGHIEDNSAVISEVASVTGLKTFWIPRQLRRNHRRFHLIVALRSLLAKLNFNRCIYPIRAHSFKTIFSGAFFNGRTCRSFVRGSRSSQFPTLDRFNFCRLCAAATMNASSSLEGGFCVGNCTHSTLCILRTHRR